MSNNEDYTNWKPQQPIGKAGISTETYYSDTSRSVVDSPIKAVQLGLPAQIPVIRPKRVAHPFFTKNVNDPTAEGEGLPSSECAGGDLGKTVVALAQDADIDDFTDAEIGHLAALADLGPGEGQGYTNLDVWD